MSRTVSGQWANCVECNARNILEECEHCEEWYCDDCIEEHELNCREQ